VVDVSPDMLEVSKAKIRASGHTASLSFKIMARSKGDGPANLM
jgi:hypothetical protein